MTSETFMMEECMSQFKVYLDYSNLAHNKYQYDGVKWCVRNELNPNPLFGIRGGFIADEMGLGKTIMMIGTMISNIVPKTLIVLPVVLLDQWYSQILKTTGHKCVIYHGKNKKIYDFKALQNARIVITTYSAVSIFKKTQASGNVLHEIQWNRIVFDEAHHLRNKNTGCFLGCSSLKGDIRWLISGTPIQNKKRDFYNLCESINLPFSFYSKKENMMVLANNFIIKRTKQQVGILLPTLVVENENVEWENEGERQLAKEIHESLSLFKRVSGTEYEKGCCTLQTMLSAKQSCIHPIMLYGKINNMIKQGIISDNVKQHEEAVNYSSKLNAVIKNILLNKDNGNGKIVFCHYHQEIDEIERRLISAGVPNVYKYDGRADRTKKTMILSNVVSNSVLIIQIQTGCEGLNLQEHFSEIYFTSPHWNPSIEDQAIARCHRIGQEKKVVVHKFEMMSFREDHDITLDDYIHNVQDYKRTIITNLYNNTA
jgi:SNF2 family DNA or RNA helicase